MSVDQQTIVRVLIRDRAKLLAYIGAIVRDYHVAEDVLQEVSALAVEKQSQILDEQTLLPWLRVAARYKSLKALEKRGRRPALMDGQLLDLMEGQWQQADRLSTQEVHESLQRCLGKLSPHARRLIELRYGAGLKGQALGEALSQKVDTLYKALTRIHAALARCMQLKHEEYRDDA